MSNPRTAVALEDASAPVGLDTVHIDSLADDQGWATLTTVFIRLDTGDTPSGNFPVYADLSDTHSNLTIGYDAAVCVQRYESWIVETYNASITSPSILRIVGKGNGSTPLLPSGNIRGTPIENTRYLNITGKYDAFSSAGREATKRMLTDLNLYAAYQSNDAVRLAVSPRTTLF